MEKKRATIKDIARELGISTSTVSRALADRWDVKPETREAVLKLAKELHYKPNPLSISLLKKKSNTIGVIIPEFVNSFFPKIIMGIESILEEKGYQLMIGHSNESADKELQNIATMENAMVDGLLVSLTTETESKELLEQLHDSGVPIVLFNRVYDELDVPMVIIDDHKWAYIATKHLIDQGCKRIAHLTGNRNLLIAEKRKQGYIDALKENGLPVDESLIVESGIMMDGAAIGAEKLLKLPQPPDGIFAINDPAAIGAMKILKRHGVRIPEDIAIIGFSESRMATIIEPNLSSVEQPTFEMGRVAAQLLLEQIDSKMQVAPKTVVLEPKLNIRESSLR